MQNRTSQRPGAHGGAHQAIALDAALSDGVSRSGNPEQRERDAEGDPIRGLRNGLIIAAGLWIALYFVIQLIIR
jgi:hypothetical protein